MIEDIVQSFEWMNEWMNEEIEEHFFHRYNCILYIYK